MSAVTSGLRPRGEHCSRKISVFRSMRDQWLSWRSLETPQSVNGSCAAARDTYCAHQIWHVRLNLYGRLVSSSRFHGRAPLKAQHFHCLIPFCPFRGSLEQKTTGAVRPQCGCRSGCRVPAGSKRPVPRPLPVHPLRCIILHIGPPMQANV